MHNIFLGGTTMKARILRLTVVVLILCITLIGNSIVFNKQPVFAGNEQPSIVFPFRTGEVWQVHQGYNNYSHIGAYTYSFDLTEVNDRTEGLAVTSPVGGFVAWIDPPNGTVAIRVANAGVNSDGKDLHWYVQLAYMKNIQVSIGGEVTQSQTKIGEASNILDKKETISHIHMTLYKGLYADVSQLNRESVPFENLEGFAWPSDGSTNQYRTTTVWRGMTLGDVGTIPTPTAIADPTAVPTPIPTGTKRLVQRDFMVERTNPKVTEELQFAVDITNDGEVAVKTTTCNIFNYILLCS